MDVIAATILGLVAAAAFVDFVTAAALVDFAAAASIFDPVAAAALVDALHNHGGGAGEARNKVIYCDLNSSQNNVECYQYYNSTLDKIQSLSQ